MTAAEVKRVRGLDLVIVRDASPFFERNQVLVTELKTGLGVVVNQPELLEGHDLLTSIAGLIAKRIEFSEYVRDRAQAAEWMAETLWRGGPMTAGQLLDAWPWPYNDSLIEGAVEDLGLVQLEGGWYDLPAELKEAMEATSRPEWVVASARSCAAARTPFDRRAAGGDTDRLGPCYAAPLP